MNELSAKIGIDGIDLEKMFNFLPYPFLISEHRNNVRSNIFFNKKFTEEIGYSPADIPTIQDWFEKAYPDAEYRTQIMTDWALQESNAMVNGTDYIVGKAKIHTKFNGDKWYEVKASVFSTVRFVAFVNIDNEIRRELELERLNQNKDLTLSILSHDLRAPLQNLYAILDLALKGELSIDEQKEALNRLRGNIFQMLEFLDTTLQWTSANFDTTIAKKETVDISRITDEIVSVYSSACQQKGIDITVNLDKSATLCGDEGMWSVLIRNILSNAIKFTPRSGTIKIYNPPMNGKYVLAIANSGVAISKEKIDDIRSLQYRSEHGTAGERGLGLGLKLCQQLLQKMNGHLDIETPNESTTIVKIVC